jgi:hypothetical protein
MYLYNQFFWFIQVVHLSVRIETKLYHDAYGAVDTDDERPMVTEVYFRERIFRLQFVA